MSFANKKIGKVKLDKEPKKTGRPTVYKPEFEKLGYQFCLLGATNEKLAALLEVSISSIEQWMREKPAFSRAIKAGREVADAMVADSLFQRALGYSHKSQKMQLDRAGKWQVMEFTEHFPPDPTSAIFWLKNRQPDKWREKLDIEQKTITVKVADE